MRRWYRRHWRYCLQAHHVRPQRQGDRRKAAASDRHILGPVAAGPIKGDRSTTLSFRTRVRARRADDSGVHVYFANGRSERGDLLVGCDGFRSSVRAHLAPEVQPIYSGYYIWRGAPNESDLSPETRRTMFPYYSFFLADQLQALGYPISGADDELRAGHRRYNFGWYRVADAAKLKQMCLDDHGREYEFGVPPPLVRRDLIAQMRTEAETLLPPQYLDCLQHIDQPFFTPVAQLGFRPRGTGGRCGLDATSAHRFWRLQSRGRGAGAGRSAFELR